MKYDAVFVVGTFAIGIGFGRIAVVLSVVSAIRKVRREERERKVRGEVVTTIRDEEKR